MYRQHVGRKCNKILTEMSLLQRCKCSIFNVFKTMLYKDLLVDNFLRVSDKSYLVKFYLKHFHKKLDGISRFYQFFADASKLENYI